jgi:hypothetical protein
MQIRDLIVRGDTESACQMMLLAFPENSEAILVAGRFRSLTRSSIMGVSSNSEKEVELNRINYSILSLAGDVEIMAMRNMSEPYRLRFPPAQNNTLNNSTVIVGGNFHMGNTYGVPIVLQSHTGAGDNIAGSKNVVTGSETVFPEVELNIIADNRTNSDAAKKADDLLDKHVAYARRKARNSAYDALDVELNGLIREAQSLLKSFDKKADKGTTDAVNGWIENLKGIPEKSTLKSIYDELMAYRFESNYVSGLFRKGAVCTNRHKIEAAKEMTEWIANNIGKFKNG